MREAMAVASVLLLAAALAWARPRPDRQAPPALPAAACETWMADAVPGVGPKNRARVAAEIRAGRVPAVAADWFSVSNR